MLFVCGSTCGIIDINRFNVFLYLFIRFMYMGIYNYVYMEMCGQALYMQIIGSVYRMIALFPYLNFVFFFFFCLL